MDTETMDTVKTETAKNAAGLEVTRIVVPAGGFEFVSPDGRRLALLVNLPDGPSLTLFNAEGLPAVSLGSSTGGGAVLVESHKTNGYVTMGADHGGFIHVGNAEGKSAVALRTTQSGGSLEVANNDRRCKAYLAVKDDHGILAVNNQDGKKIVAISGESGDGDILVTDKGGARIFAVPAWKYANSEPHQVENA